MNTARIMHNGKYVEIDVSQYKNHPDIFHLFVPDDDENHEVNIDSDKRIEALQKIAHINPDFQKKIDELKNNKKKSSNLIISNRVIQLMSISDNKIEIFKSSLIEYLNTNLPNNNDISYLINLVQLFFSLSWNEHIALCVRILFNQIDSLSNDNKIIELYHIIIKLPSFKDRCIQYIKSIDLSKYMTNDFLKKYKDLNILELKDILPSYISENNLKKNEKKVSFEDNVKVMNNIPDNNDKSNIPNKNDKNIPDITDITDITDKNIKIIDDNDSEYENKERNIDLNSILNQKMNISINSEKVEEIENRLDQYERDLKWIKDRLFKNKK